MLLLFFSAQATPTPQTTIIATPVPSLTITAGARTSTGIVAHPLPPYA